MSEESLPLRQWPAGIRQASVPANENALRVQALLSRALSVENDAPGTEYNGAVYIVGSAPTGAFSTFSEHDIALFEFGSWYAWAPPLDTSMVINDVRKVFDGTEWVDDPSIGSGWGDTDDVPEGATNLYYTDGRADDRIALQKGQPLGLATLDADAKLEANQLPALAITDTFVVNSEAAMLALDAQQGDVAVRTDEQKSYILTAEPASTLVNWQELLTPTGTGGTVTSVSLSVPTGFSVSGSPITVSGTLSMAYDTGYQGYTATEATKLSGIAAGATVGATWGTNLGSIPANITAWAAISPASKQDALSSSTSNTISGSQVQRAALTGDVTAAANSNATSLASSIAGAKEWTGTPAFRSGSVGISSSSGNIHLYFRDAADGDKQRALFYWERSSGRVILRTYDATPATSSQVVFGPGEFSFDNNTVWHEGNMRLDSGTYTPTATAVANVSSHTAYPHDWVRVGNNVTISGRVDVVPTAASTFTQIRLSLPVPSNFSAGSDVSGPATWNSGSSAIGAGFVGADAASDQIVISIISPGVSNVGIRYTVVYPILP